MRAVQVKYSPDDCKLTAIKIATNIMGNLHRAIWLSKFCTVHNAAASGETKSWPENLVLCNNKQAAADIEKNALHRSCKTRTWSKSENKSRPVSVYGAVPKHKREIGEIYA